LLVGSFIGRPVSEFAYSIKEKVTVQLFPRDSAGAVLWSTIKNRSGLNPRGALQQIGEYRYRNRKRSPSSSTNSNFTIVQILFNYSRNAAATSLNSLSLPWKIFLKTIYQTFGVYLHVLQAEHLIKLLFTLLSHACEVCTTRPPDKNIIVK
jgi:hypothetical protein